MKAFILALFLLGSSSWATSAHSVSLAWNPCGYARSVTLRIWRQKGQGAFVQIKQLSYATTSWTDTAVVAGARYSYYIIACDTKTTDCSAGSNVVSVTVP
ncbi:MAG TPA: hypothetical protein VMB66_09345 [Candidatus Acidoferrales bacterium]|nr:hypothetical protein [Candidatus Acidoferrales bacterium]